MRDVRRLLRRLRLVPRVTDPDVRLDDIAFAAGLHLYALELRPDDTYEALVITRLSDVLVGAVPPGEDVDQWYDNHVHPDDRARYDALWDPARVRAGAQFELSYRLVRDDGRVFEVIERARARRLPDGRVLLEGSVSDVTEERVARARAAEVEERLQRLMEAVEEVVYTAEFGEDGLPHLVFAGPGASRLLGGEVAYEDLWATMRARTDPGDRAERDAYFERIAAGQQASRVYRVHGFDGVTRWIWARAYPRPREEGEPLVYDGVLTDISERHQVAEELRIARDEAQRRSRVDALTEVYNRAHFVEELTHELERAAREGETPAVVMLDLDYFKRVNDTFLHAGGDIVLREVARRIADAVRSYDTVARWGGEEFVVLLPSIRDDEGLRQVAEKLRLAISSNPIPFGDDVLAVTASAGAARAGIGRFTAEALVDAADRALYSAKRRGRDRLRLYGELTESDFLMEEPDAIRIAEAMSRSAQRARGRVRPALRAGGRPGRAGGRAPVAGCDRRAALPARRLAARPRQGRDPRPRAVQGGAADRRRVGRDAHPRGAGRRDRRPHPRSGRCRARRAPPPRALRRRRLPGRAGRRRDPDRGAHRRRRRHLERDDGGPRVPLRPGPRGGADRARAVLGDAARPGRRGGPAGRDRGGSRRALSACPGTRAGCRRRTRCITDCEPVTAHAA